jgi:hypothetical protein
MPDEEPRYTLQFYTEIEFEGYRDPPFREGLSSVVQFYSEIECSVWLGVTEHLCLGALGFNL